MRCTRCDHENRPRLKFCTSCGGHLAASCPQCGAEAAPEDAFCGECGATLALASTALLPVDGRRLHTRLPAMVEQHLGEAPPPGGPELVLERFEEGRWVSTTCVLLDVSQGGLGLVCDRPIGIGTRVRVQLVAPTVASETNGEVVFEIPMELHEGTGYRAGIAFDQPRAAFVDALAGVNGGTGLLARLGEVALDHGDHAAARGWFEESLTIALGMEDQERVPRLLESFAALAASQGDHERAVRLAGAAATAREVTGGVPPPARRASVERWLGRSRLALGEPDASQAWAAGRQMSFDDAVEYALGTVAAA
jgi:hypothetical protein